MSYDGSDTVILFEELAYQDVLPVAWRPLPEQIDPDLAASYAASNVRVLQACTALQEQGQVEKVDENSPHAADFLRIENLAAEHWDTVDYIRLYQSFGLLPPGQF